ncbi:ADP-ribosylation factor-like protein 2-binding protein [Fukomys damarensis]|uniref:ADP-ribosylation factor-like protein 2-binding protein n=1 Tax=Fukomys damarensis TaxID=885580 RepID=A0A091DNW2_FUKDA|nr:ADP-ribosylation factor-like protein 2-binding protein [Fukomys damarensis]
MDALEEENLALSSSASGAELDAVVGYLEGIILEDDESQLPQRNFMDKHYQESEDTEEHKLTYTLIFNEYISLVEYIEERLLEWILGSAWQPSRQCYSTIKMKWLVTSLTCCSHLQIFWLLKKRFWTAEEGRS